MLATLALAANLMTAQPEVRGTWLTTTANTAIASPSRTAETMRTLRGMGLNTVYVEVWKDGWTEFPSEVMRRETGVALNVNPSPGMPRLQRDLLQETLIEAHRNEMVYIAWFEYGFMAAHAGTQNALRSRRDWISLNQEGGDVAKNGFVWLNPLHPDAQNLLLGIVLEAIEKYDLDGIQLDDRIVWPALEMGYDEFTQNLFAKEHGGRRPPKDIRDPEWMAWRQRKVEEFSRRFVREVRAAAGPDFIISLSPGPHPWALENYLIDWPSWSRWTDNPTWDEYVPQVYRMNFPAFEAEWNRQLGHMTARRSDLIAGIRLVGDGPDQPREQVADHVRAVRQTQGGGHVWWFSRGVLDVFPAEIAAIYDVAQNGQAPHPRFGPGWRPKPIALTRGGDGVWSGEVAPGRYRLIEKVDGQWREVSRPLISTRREFRHTSPKAEAVELLVRRRSGPL
ncbi:MAG: family 10 glycosylhydrolase [Fimbriimonadaceae bacterium]|nr:family 10 glycosylhydrolase [Fimbriimonadaceae bacterium]